MADRMYTLDADNNVVPATMEEYIEIWNSPRHIIGKTKPVPGVEVSTVFLALDHSFSNGAHEPLVFETMVFGGDLDGEVERCCTYAQAKNMHTRWVRRVIEAEKSLGQKAADFLKGLLK